MKPGKLVLCGWGPYKEKQEIDFSLLSDRGIFLITGPTGAGKTTIFDAITYALYGNMSGLVREKNSVRSDFAGEGIPTYVELSMTHGKEEYFIYRNPEYLRPKKRKTGKCEMTKEKERAYLLLPDGSKIEGASEVSNKVREILRLDYKQFKQLSLIAQGEFAKLLTASPGEKARIFREIFDTELYDKAAGLLRARSNHIYKQVMEYRHKMEEDISFFVPMKEDTDVWQKLTEGQGYYYDEILTLLGKIAESRKILLKEQQGEHQKVQQETEELTRQLTEAERWNNLSEQFAAEEVKQKELSERLPFIEEKENKLKQARQALLVRTYEQVWQNAVRIQEELLDKNTALEYEVTKLSEALKQEEAFRQRWQEIEKAYENKKLEDSLKRKQQELLLISEKQKQILSAMQQEYLQAEQEEVAAGTEYETVERGYRRAMAGILADELQENEPCPVCGSVHHPKKAEVPQGVPTPQQVEEKKLLFEEKRQACVSLHGKVSACRERTESYLENLAQLSKELEAVAGEINKQDPVVRDYTKQYSREMFLERKKEYEAESIRLKEKETLLAEGKREAEQKAVELEAAKEAYIEKRLECGFEGEESYKRAFMPEKEQKQMEEEAAGYREARHANEQMLLHLKEELAGKKPMDIVVLQERLAVAKVKRDESQSLLAEMSHYVQDIEKMQASLRMKNEKKKKLENEYGVVKRLDDAVSGNNRLRLVFEQYVLAAYFEEILKAANIRLKTMTSGRYELRRMEAVGDGRKKDNLEMEVMDYYTGKYRSVKTLSGGESFKTSLALALGMSDVVQAFSGGVRVEALFIDEGFGSLDSESLEQAALTLQSLVEKDRLIGIISHVPELSEKIANKIRIHKSNAGSRTEIMIS